MDQGTLTKAFISIATAEELIELVSDKQLVPVVKQSIAVAFAFAFTDPQVSTDRPSIPPSLRKTMVEILRAALLQISDRVRLREERDKKEEGYQGPKMIEQITAHVVSRFADLRRDVSSGARPGWDTPACLTEWAQERCRIIREELKGALYTRPDLIMPMEEAIAREYASFIRDGAPSQEH